MIRTAFFLLLAGCATRPILDELPDWEKLHTEPAKDKQDDLWFTSPEKGWYVNSIGKIYRTADGGKHWFQVLDQPGTYWRSILFIDDRHGFAGNLGPGAVEGFKTVLSPEMFENLNREAKVTDPTLMYETRDGGRTWAALKDYPRGPGGICSMNSFMDASGRPTVWAGGRVTGPARIFRWTEERGWDSMSVAPLCGMVLDISFQSPEVGIVCAATGADPATSFASILRTEDAGLSWKETYRSTRPGETVWKCSFPGPETGYATVRSFSSDPARTKQYIVKTTDGGKTWEEIPVVDDFHCRPQAIAFLSPERGWVGTTSSGFETRDGGASWTRSHFGRNVNRLRIVRHPEGGHVIYALGQDLYRLRLR